MIEEVPLKNFQYELKNSKLNYPNCTCNECPRMYFNLLSVGARGSGKTYNVVKLCKHYEQNKLIDNDGLIHPLRTIVISPTIDANPIFLQLKSLAQEDIHNEYSEDLLRTILEEIKKNKEETDEYNKYVKAYKEVIKISERRLQQYFKKNPDIFDILEKHDFQHYDEIPQPKYKVSPVNIIVLDDLLCSNAFCMKANSVLTNAIIKNRHNQTIFCILSQSVKSIPKVIRLNCSLFFLSKFACKKVILEDLYEVVSNVLTPEQFDEIYTKAVEEKYGALVVDNTTEPKRFYRGFSEQLLFIKNNISPINKENVKIPTI